MGERVDGPMTFELGLRAFKFEPDRANRAPFARAARPSAIVMRVTVIQAKIGRKWHHRPVRCAAKHCLQVGTQRLRGLIRSTPEAGPAAGALKNGKGLSSKQIHTMFKSNGMPLGECRLKHLGVGLIQRVTDRSAIEAAMDEFDELGGTSINCADLCAAV